jgi:hypothetical protein
MWCPRTVSGSEGGISSGLELSMPLKKFLFLTICAINRISLIQLYVINVSKVGEQY